MGPTNKSGVDAALPFDFEKLTVKNIDLSFPLDFNEQV